MVSSSFYDDVCKLGETLKTSRERKKKDCHTLNRVSRPFSVEKKNFAATQDRIYSQERCEVQDLSAYQEFRRIQIYHVTTVENHWCTQILKRKLPKKVGRKR